MPALIKATAEHEEVEEEEEEEEEEATHGVADRDGEYHRTDRR